MACNVTLANRVVFGLCGIICTGFLFFGCCSANRDHVLMAMLETCFQIVPFEKNSLYGFKNGSGRVLVSPRFFFASGHNDGLARVINIAPGEESHYKWIYVNTNGIQAFAGVFDEARDFSQGRAFVVRTNSVMLIDTTGAVISSGHWSTGRRFSEDIAAVNEGGDWFGMGGKWGYINFAGEYVILPQYTYADRFHGGYAVASTNGHWSELGAFFYGAQFGIINKKGEFVVLPKWRTIIRNIHENSFDLTLGNGMGTTIDCRPDGFAEANMMAAACGKSASEEKPCLDLLSGLE